ncbi:hypothetical protein DOY81_013997, partial [Sarcophaga bullata]
RILHMCILNQLMVITLIEIFYLFYNFLEISQMLMKWFISSLQNNCNHLSEQDISMLTLQYCNNLINVGVLKQISEKNDLETFK